MDIWAQLFAQVIAENVESSSFDFVERHGL